MAVTAQGGAAAPGSDQNANTIFAGPATGVAGAPLFRSQVIADLPANIPNSSLASQGFTDYIALKELGTSIKAWPPGNLPLTQAGSQSMVSGTIVYTVEYVPSPVTLTGVQFVLTVSGVYTSTGYNGFALFSINTGTGALTQIAATTSSTTLWSAGVGFNNIPFSSTIAVNEGVYVVAALYQNSAQVTAPAVNTLNMQHSNYGSRDFPNNIKLVGTSSGTTIPTSINFSAIAGLAWIPNFYLY